MERERERSKESDRERERQGEIGKEREVERRSVSRDKQGPLCIWVPVCSGVCVCVDVFPSNACYGHTC